MSDRSSRNGIEELSLRLLLSNAGLSDFTADLLDKNLTVATFLNLNLRDLEELIKGYNPDVKSFFKEKYLLFMKSNGIVLDESFIESNENADPLWTPSSNENSSDSDPDSPRKVNSEPTITDAKDQNQRTMNIDGNNVLQPTKTKPLVDRNAVGAKRRMTSVADEKVAEFDLEVLLKAHPLCSAILDNYKVKKLLSKDDRSQIAREIVAWILSLTNLPTRTHYQTLTEKIVNLFPSEEPQTWFISSDPQNGQKYAKGKLPDKVKNMKTKMVEKGALPPQKRFRKQSDDPSQPGGAFVNNEDNMESQGAITWLSRNREPFEEVKSNWKLCAKYRLTQLYKDASCTPHNYIQKWCDVLKLPNGYQLVTDDFDEIAKIESYEYLVDKSGNLLKRWTQFTQKVVKLISGSPLTELSKKDQRQNLSVYENAKTESDKDYAILQVLPALCRQTGRVKLGDAPAFKPTTKESLDSFIFHVSDATELENEKRKRQQYCSERKIPLQPYIIVVGSTRSQAKDVYVVINETTWKLNSVLQGLDVCFKSFYSLNCEYSLPAKHLWLFVQKYLYDIVLNTDVYCAPVDNFIKVLNSLSGDAE